jgi:hypothetical protein
MPETSPIALRLQLQRLETHLEQENPVLLQVVRSFKKLDEVAYRLGLLKTHESFATKVPWWPMISVVGVFSSGKSSFINHYLGQKLQTTGNQAVDDKFTVICFSSDTTSRTLPGLALDADPRFPFYRVSRDIEEVASGEGQRVDAYLQLKTCSSERLRGKIIIDSPGFDADAQRTSTLRITDHILDLSDLVLVFFDARHPEPGAMQDTLLHLVSNTIHRPDSNKFLYILNQIDATAREDNPEEVFAAWQRSLAQAGLTAGRFYRIYNPSVAFPIENEKLRLRFEAKRDADLGEIYGRMQQVEVERAYRIIGVLEKTAKSIEDELVPKLYTAKRSWRRLVLWLDGTVIGLLVLAFLSWSILTHHWEGLHFIAPPWMAQIIDSGWVVTVVGLIGVAALSGYMHAFFRKFASGVVERRIKRQNKVEQVRDLLLSAFIRNTQPLHPVFMNKPAGWGNWARRKLAEVLAEADEYVENLNDRFTNPSGTVVSSETPVTGPAAVLVEKTAEVAREQVQGPPPFPEGSAT